MIPAPGRVLLRPIETEESIGRIALLDSTREKMTPNQYEVVSVGWPNTCEDEECDRPHILDRLHRNPCHVNDWVLVRHRCVVPTENPNLFIAWQDDILAILSLKSAPPLASGTSAR